MSPRADEPPRRGSEPRRGASPDLPTAEGRDAQPGRGFGGIGDARAYTPRGRTVREGDQRTRSPRAGRNADPFRPALQVLDGGQPTGRGRPPADTGEAPPPARRPGPGRHDEDTGPGHDSDAPRTRRRGRDEPAGRERPDERDRTPAERRAAGSRAERAPRARAADLDDDRSPRRRRTAEDRTGSARTVQDRDDQRRSDGSRSAGTRPGRGVEDRSRVARDRGARDRDRDDRGRDARDRDDRGRDDRGGDDRSRDDRGREARDRDRGLAERARAERGRTERARAERGRTERGRAERGRAERGRIERGRIERPGSARAGRDREDEWDDREPARPRRTATARTTAGAARPRATAGSRRTESPGRRVAVPPVPRRIAGGRAVKLAPPPRQTTRRPPPVPAEPPKLANSTRRLRLGTVLALALFLTIGVRLVVLQVNESPAEAQSLLEQRQSRLTDEPLPAARGSILDRSGTVLAQSVEARLIYADPELVVDSAAVAARLSPLLGQAPSTLIAKMARGKRPGPAGGAIRFAYLARGVDIAVADRIAAMKLKGIREDLDERRDVPGADLAANLIGFTGEAHTGLEGLEARYDELLSGTDGERVYETGNPHVDNGDLAKEIPSGYHRETAAQDGTSLKLTIDADLQYEIQTFLSEDMKRVKATIGAAVVLDRHTGEVLAQASYPGYNAAKPFDAKPADRDDVATSVIADPGSTHKAFTLAAALQEGVITPQSAITVGPALERGGYTFADTHEQKAGTKLTIPGVLAYSSNVGTILIADKLGKQKLYEYQQKFGLGQATGEGMPGEATGRLLPPDEWSGSASGSVPIGMSVDATLMQMTAGYAAIANDGTYIQPHLIASTIDPAGHVTPAPAPESHQVLSPGVAQELRSMMEAVVDVKGATGTQAAVPGFRVAGKTGTGKMLTDGRYTKHNAGSFIGMAPAEDPRYVIGVFADVPDGTGGDVAAPAFSKMMSFTLRHYLVPPSGTKPPTFTIHP